MAADLGFAEQDTEEIVLVAGELATNLVRHAAGGTMVLAPAKENGRSGVQIETVDAGPGIRDVDRALTDGYTTRGSLGYGLGTVNRLMDELDISAGMEGRGTHLTCRRWVRSQKVSGRGCPLSFGAATRCHPKMNLNGDAFVIKKWGESALVAVIDGLGHGQFAHRAAEKAREYIERHFDLPLADIFRGTGHSCRATRGLVMALARFDWAEARLTYAAIGNIETRVMGPEVSMRFPIRRGIVGLNAPAAPVSEHRWEPDWVMILHSDGLTTKWRWEDLGSAVEKPATAVSQEITRRFATDNDDATVVVVKGNSK